jgi:hypothetical protein
VGGFVIHRTAAVEIIVDDRRGAIHTAQNDVGCTVDKLPSEGWLQIIERVYLSIDLSIGHLHCACRLQLLISATDRLTISGGVSRKNTLSRSTCAETNDVESTGW